MLRIDFGKPEEHLGWERFFEIFDDSGIQVSLRS